jgi:hypothetical protein
MYTIEVYKKDKRTINGERLFMKVDHSTTDLDAIEKVYSTKYPSDRGYRYEIHKTFVTRLNMMSMIEYQERYDTPYFCSPSSESYWSM